VAGHARYTALLDACVLYPLAMTDALMSLATAGLYAAKWTVRIETEWIAALEERRPDLKGRLDFRRDQMREAIPDWEVPEAAWQACAGGLRLPDPDDVHVLAAALAVGGSEHALDITVQYSKDREQFDKPLGAFQALSHYMSDAKTLVDGAKMLTYEAAWAHDLGRPLDRLAPMAKLFAANTYRDITAMAQQIFGGVGFTLEYEIQMYFRRAKQLQITWNDTRRCEDLIAAAILDAA